MSEPEQIRYNSRTLEQMDDFCHLDDTKPYEWKRTDEIYNDAGEHIANRTHEYVLADLSFLRKLKGIAVSSRYSLAKSQGNGELARFILNPPKPNPLRNKDGGVR